MTHTDITPVLCKAGRVLAGWEQTDLAERAEVSEQTVRNFETGRRMPHARNRAKITTALASAGIRLTVSVYGYGVYREVPIPFKGDR